MAGAHVYTSWQAVVYYIFTNIRLYIYEYTSLQVVALNKEREAMEAERDFMIKAQDQKMASWSEQVVLVPSPSRFTN